MPDYGDVLGQVESTSELPLVDARTRSISGSRDVLLSALRVSEESNHARQGGFSQAPEQCSGGTKRTRPRTFSYVFISYGCSNDWAKKAANAELTQTWKALEAEEISRPIAHEEIVRRQADEFSRRRVLLGRGRRSGQCNGQAFRLYRQALARWNV